MNRRKFLHLTTLAAPIAACKTNNPENPDSPAPGQKPIVISTWEPNKKANASAWAVLEKNGYALDAIVAGIMVPEADPEDQSVGYGGLPDRDGRVTLDSAIMDEKANIGAVMCLEFIKHPIQVARLVMEKTPHVQIVGEGALDFALANGFKKENLLSPKSEAKWRKWLKEAKYSPMTTVETILETIENQHDTIGMLSIDSQNRLCGGCSTSGLAYKMRGRVGDSPIIGAGLYVDSEVGAASATGVGEELVRIVGSHTVVELMRQGKTPEEACRETIGRLVKIKGEEIARNLQIALIALNVKGQYGCYSLTPGFTAAVHTANGPQVIKAKSWFAEPVKD